MMERKLRKSENTMVNVGGAVILLAVWNLTKSVLVSFQDDGQLLGGSGSQSGDYRTGIISVVAWVLVTGIILVLQVYIGRRAIKEGKGEQGGIGYLILAGLGVSSEVAGIITLFVIGGEQILDPSSGVSLLQLFAGCILELTWIYTITLLIISSLRLRRIRKQLAG